MSKTQADVVGGHVGLARLYWLGAPLAKEGQASQRERFGRILVRTGELGHQRFGLPDPTEAE